MVLVRQKQGLAGVGIVVVAPAVEVVEGVTVEVVEGVPVEEGAAVKEGAAVGVEFLSNLMH